MSDLLPIYELDEEILEAMPPGGRLVLSAPTGSGKSTQVPQILLDGGGLGEGRCVILQPRRMAARMLARRVAEERGCPLGGEVGYQIRLDNVSCRETRILYVTEGILLRQMLADPRLGGVSTILFDEFHERHLYGDITLARALDLQESLRPDLRIGVMSATLDGAALEDYLVRAVRLESGGRTFPVEIEYLRFDPREDPPWELAADAVEQCFDRTEGNILIFMPGAYEIARTIREVGGRLGGKALIVPLHGELPAAEQDKAVAPSAVRKVIVSTNVAETSLTIEGVRTVIDSGLARVARYDPHRGINTLLIEKISKASADQRAGRAGRTAPGLCLRLWSERQHATRAPSELPEIRRLDLAETILTLKAAGVEDLRTFRWLDAPEPGSLIRAESLLTDLGALGEDGRITPTGKRMLSFPVHPRYARMFLAASELGCVRAAALIAALTQTRGILLKTDRRIEEERREIFGAGTSDFFLHMRAYAWAENKGFRAEGCRPLAIHAEAARQVGQLFRQFLDIASAEGLSTEAVPASDEAIARCILAGFADQVARRRSGGTLQCDIVHGRKGSLARASIAQNSRLLVAAEIIEIEGRDGTVETVLSLATEIEEAWLKEMFPGHFTERREAVFDKTQNRVVIRSERVFRDLVIESKDRDAEPSPMASACLAAEIFRGDLRLNGWDDEAEQFIQRVNFLAAAMPELEIKKIGAEERELLIAELCDGAVCYRDVKDKPALPALRAWLAPRQAVAIEKHAPQRIELPGGRRAKVTYHEARPPVLAARIQDLYGVTGGLAVAGGRVPLTIEVLAPNFRPIQVTSDLKRFWAESYPEIKSALQRRYPRHEWR
ncbi:MAG: ATP-dependent helicase HrpB [Terrimicrobiaceae bacterium]